MNIPEVSELDVEVSEVLGDRETLSPYRLASVASVLMGRYVREQLVYSYVRQGLIKGHKDQDGKWTVTREVAHTWLVKYVRKNR